jgi:hypothetical protein
MSRHLGDLDDAEVYSLQSHIVNWLESHDVAGSAAQDYNLYRVLEEEHEKARLACEVAARN